MSDYIKRTDALRIIDEVYGARSKAYQRIQGVPAEAVVSEADYQQALETVEKIRGDAYMRHRQALEAEEELLRADKYGYWIPRHGGEWVDCSECGTVGSPHWKRCPVCEAKILPPRCNGDEETQLHHTE